MTAPNPQRYFNCEICGDECVTRDKRSHLCKKVECRNAYMRKDYGSKLYDKKCSYCGSPFVGKYRETNCSACKDRKIVLDLPVITRNILCPCCNEVTGTETKKVIHSTLLVNNRKGKNRVCKKCKKKNREKFALAVSGSGNINYGKRGAEMPHWNGGVNKKKYIRTGLIEKWVNPILERDNRTCLLCGTENGRLHVHHCKDSFKKILARIVKQHNFDIKNLTEEQVVFLRDEVARFHVDNNVQGITLCSRCHEDIHSIDRANNLGAFDMCNNYVIQSQGQIKAGFILENGFNLLPDH